jgi:hypothetical protein
MTERTKLHLKMSHSYNRTVILRLSCRRIATKSIFQVIDKNAFSGMLITSKVRAPRGQPCLIVGKTIKFLFFLSVNKHQLFHKKLAALAAKCYKLFFEAICFFVKKDKIQRIFVLS